MVSCCPLVCACSHCTAEPLHYISLVGFSLNSIRIKTLMKSSSHEPSSSFLCFISCWQTSRGASCVPLQSLRTTGPTARQLLMPSDSCPHSPHKHLACLHDRSPRVRYGGSHSQRVRASSRTPPAPSSHVFWEESCAAIITTELM